VFGACFGEPQPWLPRAAALDADRLVGALARQAETGWIS
jgi:hypothetical protein